MTTVATEHKSDDIVTEEFDVLIVGAGVAGVGVRTISAHSVLTGAS